MILFITNTNQINETIYPTIKAAVEDVSSGQIDAETIGQVIEVDLATGTSRDITQLIALEVWRTLDAENSFAWREMRDWLEAHNLDCDHLTGETKDIRHFYGL